MFTTCGLCVAVRFQNQTMFTIKQHLSNDTSNPSICIQYYLLEINFHKGTYSQHVETLTVGEEFFSVVQVSQIVFLTSVLFNSIASKNQYSSQLNQKNRSEKMNWHSNRT